MLPAQSAPALAAVIAGMADRVGPSDGCELRYVELLQTVLGRRPDGALAVLEHHQHHAAPASLPNRDRESVRPRCVRRRDPAAGQRDADEAVRGDDPPSVPLPVDRHRRPAAPLAHVAAIVDAEPQRPTGRVGQSCEAPRQGDRPHRAVRCLAHAAGAGVALVGRQGRRPPHEALGSSRHHVHARRRDDPEGATPVDGHLVRETARVPAFGADHLPPGAGQVRDPPCRRGPEGAGRIEREGGHGAAGQPVARAVAHQTPVGDGAHAAERVADPERAVSKRLECVNAVGRHRLTGRWLVPLEADTVEAKEPRRRAEPEETIARLRERQDAVRRAIARRPRAVGELRECDLGPLRGRLRARRRAEERDAGADQRVVGTPGGHEIDTTPHPTRRYRPGWTRALVGVAGATRRSRARTTAVHERLLDSRPSPARRDEHGETGPPFAPSPAPGGDRRDARTSRVSASARCAYASLAPG
jgi:hypothetical protein